MITSRRSLTWLGGTGFLIAFLAKPAQTNTQRSSSTMGDQAAIINAVNGIAIFADLRDWNRCRQSFADEVEFDYTAMVGGQPTVIAADRQMQQWSTFFNSTFKNTQHIRQLSQKLRWTGGNLSTVPFSPRGLRCNVIPPHH